MTVEKLIKYGSITREIADKLELLVKAKYNIFICGGTGSGKTNKMMNDFKLKLSGIKTEI